MKSEILFQGSYALLKVDLEPGEEVKAEPGAMVAMTDTITMQVKKSSSGFFKSLKARFLGGENFFNSYFRAEDQPGSLFLAPKAPGSIAKLNLNKHEGFILEKGAFLAANPSVNLDTKFQGFAKGLFNREGFFLIKVEGEGEVFLNCFGGLEKVELQPGEKFIVDNGHLVAFSSNTDYEIKKAGGWIASVFSGEGLVLEFTGPGTIYLQARNPGEFGKWLMAFIPLPSSSPSKSFSGTRQHFEDEYNRSEEFENEPEEFDIESEPFEEVDPSFDDSEDI